VNISPEGVHSGKKTTYALSILKGNAVKNQHRNDIQQTPRLFRQPNGKVPSAFAVLKVNFSFYSRQKSLRLKVYSLGTGTQKGTHINPNKELLQTKQLPRTKARTVFNYFKH
jgi:hypothetical protein